MRIVNAKLEKSKSARMREIAKEIAGDKEKAAFFETESDLRRFRQIVRQMGFKTSSDKLRSGGWRIWVIGLKNSG